MLVIATSLAAKQLTARDRALTKYARYRTSKKGQERTRRYNSGPAHQEACMRYRLTHWREIKERRLDARIAKERASWGPDLPTAAERMLGSLGLNPWLLRDEEAWNRAHARVGKAFLTDAEVAAKAGIIVPEDGRSSSREYWTKRHKRKERNGTT